MKGNYCIEQKEVLLFRKSSLWGVSNCYMSLSETCFYSETSKICKIMSQIEMCIGVPLCYFILESLLDPLLPFGSPSVCSLNVEQEHCIGPMEIVLTVESGVLTLLV